METYPDTPQRRSKQYVYDYIMKDAEIQSLSPPLVIEEIYIISFYTVGGSWRTILETSLPDNTYYEVGYNATTGALHLTTYREGETVDLDGS